MRGYMENELRTVYAMWQDGYKWRAIAAQFGWERGKTKHAIRAARRQYASAPACEGHDQGAGLGGLFVEYTFTGLETARPALPRFDGEPHVYGDCIVAGDFHLPTTDYALAGMLLDVARVANIKTLLIVGDLVNMDIFSHFDHILPPLPFQVEVEAAVSLIERYAAWFDVMWLALGNHEHRLLKLSKGEIDSSMLGRLLSSARGKLKVTPYSHIVVHSGDEVWRCTHQRNYSRLKGRVGDELAQKYQCNIVSHHQHHAGKIMDRYGRYVIIDNGGLHDQTKIAYASLVDNTSPTMTRGFTVLRDGCGHLITPYPAYTDLNEWLAPRQARKAAA